MTAALRRRDIVVSGVGMHPFGRFVGKSAVHLGAEAVVEALNDADVDLCAVDALYCGHKYGKSGAGQRIADLLGLTGLPVIDVEDDSTSGTLTLALARQAIASQTHRTVVAVGVEKMPPSVMDKDHLATWRQRAGHAANPAHFALAIRRHMHEYGTTEDQLAMVAVKNHRHSVHNNRAMCRCQFSAEEILSSPAVADPLRLLMLSAPSEGAAAAVLTGRSARPDDVVLIGQGLHTVTRDQAIGEYMPLFSHIDEHSPSVTRRAATEAYATAGLGPEDIDVVELHDTDAGTEIISSEELGLCERGEGGQLVASGATAIGGRIPVNTSGGLLSKGEPVGASGLAQVFEIVQQLRGNCGLRQVADARIGLTHALGGGGNCSVLIFRRH
jgi:acetyl-CoA acetyltransferase